MTGLDFAIIAAGLLAFTLVSKRIGRSILTPPMLFSVFGLLITFAGVGMVALPAGILASGYSLELQSRREAFRLQVRRAMDEEQSSTRQARELDETRGELGLTEEEAQQVIESEQAEQADRGPPACPHCGKPLAAPPPRP